MKYRHLSRSSAHRQALLRNLVTSLVKHEAIHTTWPKAKEAQRLAEKLITLAKRNNETSRRSATAILFVCAPSFNRCLAGRQVQVEVERRKERKKHAQHALLLLLLFLSQRRAEQAETQEAEQS